MRILHYVAVYAPAWKYGGPARSVSELCEGLASIGHSVTVLTTNSGLEGRSDIGIGCAVNRNGVSVHYFPATPAWTGIQSCALERAVNLHLREYDILHVTGVWQPTTHAACRAARRAHIPYVSSPRGALSHYSFGQKPWKKWPYYFLRERQNLLAAAALHYTSRFELDECKRLNLRAPAFIVPNALNFQRWQNHGEAAKRWRAAHAITDDEFIMLYTGRFHHKKGLDILPKVCAPLPCRSRWRVVMVGFDEDGTRDNIRQEFVKNGQADRLIVLDGVEQEELAIIYSAADLFVFPSRHENFANSVIEALACGCPVVLSPNVGVAGELTNVAEATVLPLDATRWTEFIESRINERPHCDAQRMAVSMKALFSRDMLAARMVTHYNEVLSSYNGRN